MKRFKSLVIFSSTFLAVILFFEFFLSFCGILQPIVRIDPIKGERYRPDITCSSLFVSEGFGLAKTNADGWFGHIFNDKGEDEISVAVIGNSYVASRQVFYRNNFIALTEKETNKILRYKNLSTSVSLFNFGKEDLPLNELLYVKEDIEINHHPDYFLIFLNQKTFDVVRDRYVARYEIENDKFKLDTSFRQKPFVKNYHSFEFFTESSFLFLGHRVLNYLPKAGEILFDKFYIQSKDEEKKEETSAAFYLNREDKLFVKELSKDKRVIFLLNVDPQLTSDIKSLIGNSISINIQPVLLEAKQKGKDPNYWEIPDKTGHFNLFGHQLIANELTKEMIELAIRHENKNNLHSVHHE